ncbi:hypothetical protein IC620_00325 [Hazenella sp. IB182357]|uniref:Uncharacterized protein n=1 Tax=Polycladospora coralii TaxID=2771432 RepID=A0A926N988_9BACL|nr:hypothetical protein [Polycladospora coralii]MBD1370805.1 hypothetical protein [Polycladospora coralii]MBS7529744.1 hypothetical protein [Polycladospora coralii]
MRKQRINKHPDVNPTQVALREQQQRAIRNKGWMYGFLLLAGVIVFFGIRYMVANRK